MIQNSNLIGRLTVPFRRQSGHCAPKLQRLQADIYQFQRAVWK